MTQKIKFLLVLNVVLLAAIVVSVSGVEKRSTVNVNNIEFRLTDTIDVQKITINDFELKRETRDWKLNGTHTVDPDKIATLLAVMQRLEVKRPVSPNKKDSISSLIQKDGLDVKVFGAESVSQQYQLISNDMMGHVFQSSSSSSSSPSPPPDVAWPLG